MQRFLTNGKAFFHLTHAKQGMGEVLHGPKGHGRVCSKVRTQKSNTVFKRLDGLLWLLQGKVGTPHTVQHKCAAKVVIGVLRGQFFEGVNAGLRLALLHQV